MAASEKGCCVHTCGKTRKDDTVLHSFPKPEKEMDRYLAWTQAVGGDVSTLDPRYVYKNRRVCHAHFDSKHLTWTRRLSPDAVPTLFLPDTDIPPTTTSNKSRPRNERTGLFAGTVTKKGETSPDNEPVDDQIQYDEDTSNINEEDFHNDQVLQSKTAEPSETFSWQKSATVPWDADTEVNEKDLLMQCDEADELYMYPESGVSSAGTRGGEDAVPVTRHLDRIQQEYRCNECSENINGFLYTCVQCADYDLCASCEARGCHPNHYVLRVPGGRPHGEMLSVLQTLRRVLVTDSVVQMDQATVDELKVEVKEEAVDPIDVEQVEAGPGGPREERNDSEQDVETAEENEDTLEENTETLEENIETEESIETLEEDIEAEGYSEMIEEHLDTESSWSPHSHRSDLPEYVYSKKTVGTRSLNVTPDTSQELYYVVGLDEQNRRSDVRLSEDKKTALKRRLGLVEPKTYKRKTTDVERGVPVSSNTLQTHMVVPRVVVEDIRAARKS